MRYLPSQLMLCGLPSLRWLWPLLLTALLLGWSGVALSVSDLSSGSVRANQGYDPYLTNVSFVSGKVKLYRNGQWQELNEGNAIRRGDVLLTALHARIHVILGEDTVLEIGGESEVAIPQFQSLADEEGGLKGWFKLQQGSMRIYTLPVTINRDRKFQINLAQDIPQIYALFGRQNVDVTVQVMPDGATRFLGHSVCAHSGDNRIYQRVDNEDTLIEALKQANQCFRTDTPDGVSPTYSLIKRDIDARYAATAARQTPPLSPFAADMYNQRKRLITQRLQQATDAAANDQREISGQELALLNRSNNLPSNVYSEDTLEQLGPTRQARALGEPAYTGAGRTAVPPSAEALALVERRRAEQNDAGQQEASHGGRSREPALTRQASASSRATNNRQENDRQAARQSARSTARSTAPSQPSASRRPAVVHRVGVPRPRYQTAASNGNWRVYVMSIPDLKKASEIVFKLRKAGFDANLEGYIHPTRQRRYARVYIANLPSSIAAKQTGKDLVGVLGIRDFWIRNKG